uniref:Uncharacterized protein n=1 Tax=Craspedostauros australis TaxID=1486917 RepID=A0A7R9WUH6_9STRA|mmetsp:Transcript_20668/g.57442  ORF Transcript_20668/g.57442 Transcript_20668/m.57442 type:complete len:103 (+) Transcript_20668:238-546(+)
MPCQFLIETTTEIHSTSHPHFEEREKLQLRQTDWINQHRAARLATQTAPLNPTPSAKQHGASTIEAEMSCGLSEVRTRRHDEEKNGERIQTSPTPTCTVVAS